MPAKPRSVAPARSNFDPIIGESVSAVVSIFLLAVSFFTPLAVGQSIGNSGSIEGSVTDPTGAVIPKATVEIRHPVSGFDRTGSTDSAGKFAFTDVPFNPYHLTVVATASRPMCETWNLARRFR